jgi:DNA-binding response OmpR family regulator
MMCRVLLIDPDYRTAKHLTAATPGCAIDGDMAIDWAQNPFHARALLREHSYDVVLVERVLHGLQAPELVAELRKLLPTARIAILSGLQQPPGNGVRPRPTGPLQMLQLVADLLAAPPDVH